MQQRFFATASPMVIESMSSSLEADDDSNTVESEDASVEVVVSLLELVVTESSEEERMGSMTSESVSLWIGACVCCCWG